jgi:hypothetical protein
MVTKDKCLFSLRLLHFYQGPQLYYRLFASYGWRLLIFSTPNSGHHLAGAGTRHELANPVLSLIVGASQPSRAINNVYSIQPHTTGKAWDASTAYVAITVFQRPNSPAELPCGGDCRTT